MGKHATIHQLETQIAPNPLAATVEVNVTPISGGWSVAASFNESPLVFKSGARAERAGRDLAAAAVKAGLAVHLRIETRDGKLAGQARYDSGTTSSLH